MGDDLERRMYDDLDRRLNISTYDELAEQAERDAAAIIAHVEHVAPPQGPQAADALRARARDAATHLRERAAKYRQLGRELDQR